MPEAAFLLPLVRKCFETALPAAARNLGLLRPGGSGQGNFGGVEAAPFAWHNQSHRLTLSLPPRGAVAFKPA